jgi:tRNA pseudouridine55 synthase
LQERAVAIHELRLLSFSPGERATGLFEVHCGKGTYVRSLATIIGQRVGSCAFASFVLRIQIGPFSVSDACTLEELEALSRERRLLDIAVSESYALSGYPSVNTTPDQARLLIHGNAIPLLTRYHPGQILVAYDSDGNLVAIGEARGTRPQMLQPRTVVAGGR